ncbi:uncharacterized protein LOC144646232 [Oculina patagonica]
MSVTFKTARRPGLREQIYLNRRNMKVICAGLSKTGTKSIAKALQILGFSVFDFKEHITIHHDEWASIYRRGKQPDFLSMYQDVDAVTDLPAAVWYEEIYQAFPDAKVILSVRDSEEVWVQSWANQTALFLNAGFLRTIIMSYILPYIIGIDVPLFEEIGVAAYGTLRPKSTVLYKKKYREHNERVQAVIPKEKLLVFNVKQGWKPLCEFLGCEKPDQEFPRENVTGSKGSVGNEGTSIINNARNKLFVIFAVFGILASVFYLTYSF